MKQAEFIDKITYFQTETLDKIMKTHKVLFLLGGLRAQIKCENFNGIEFEFTIRVTDEDDIVIDSDSDKTLFLFESVSKKLPHKNKRQ